MATHSSILAWEIPWIEEPGGLQPTGSDAGVTEHANVYTWLHHPAVHLKLSHIVNRLNSNTK